MSSPSSPPRFQFSLRWLFAVLTLVAVLLGFAFLGPVASFLLWLVIVVVMPTPLVILALFGHGPRQAFAIGALLPWFVTMMGRFPNFPDNGGSTAARLLLLLLAGVACGGAAVATRNWLDR